ncbi:FAD-binding protein [Rhodococcus artemisiae]|uniref:FAD-binding protein n=1 Tax=Rhodococcus artemisiae TaxID=714159 RepID=A0ABU7LCB6_9NOCA|nr:FAD-binding protein [Rhodococcus artemisiae]MEE2059178.1 FAD-binding protein [Rhodococcus artemisiae]
MTHDVIVLGSGAAGLAAVLSAHDAGADVGIYEKAEYVGGTAAWSGGMVWMPNNPHMKANGISDSPEEAFEYIKSLTHGLVDDSLLRAFLEHGPEAVSWLEEHTPVEFELIAGFPDYHPTHPGAKESGGRTMACPLFPFAELGEWASKVWVGHQLPSNIAISETTFGEGAGTGPTSEDLERRKIRDERGTGQALVGAMLRGCLDRGITPRTGVRARSLIVEDGRVAGVRFDTDGVEFEVRARRAVILATGGFEHNAERVRSFLRGPLDRPVSVPTNTGDGLDMAMRVGASLGNMREAWWAPTIDIDHPDLGRVPWLVNGERSRPHSIMVNRAGVRFANESANYNAFGAAFHYLDVSSYNYSNHPAWLIFDHHYLTKFGLASHSVASELPDWITRAESFETLAKAIDVPETALVATVRRWNENAVAGHDPDFGRGESTLDRWWGDRDAGDSAAANVAPLDAPPYYAVQVRSGALGTKGGPCTDAHGRVQSVDGTAIPGLYAAGNAMASVMGMTYGGAGGTLGPALTYGWLAGRDAAVAPRGDGDPSRPETTQL